LLQSFTGISIRYYFGVASKFGMFVKSKSRVPIIIKMHNAYLAKEESPCSSLRKEKSSVTKRLRIQQKRPE